jgi:hypothetical protein
VLLGFELGIAVTAGVLQATFLTNLRESSLPSGVVDEVAGRLLSEGGTAEDLGDPGTQSIVGHALSDAVNAALLACVLMALVGAVLGLFFGRSHRTIATGGAPS